MIQRIQTIWLLIASIAAFLTLRFSFYSGTWITDNSYHELRGIDNTYLMFATIILGGLSFINIFLFKKRPVQIRIALLCILLEAFVLFLYVRELQIFSNGNYNLWAFLHLVIIIGLVMAIMGMYKDQKLIKESNRLR